MYCEQTCNHPPISHFYVVGPENLYIISGYTQYDSSAGFNSLTVRIIIDKKLRKKANFF